MMACIYIKYIYLIKMETRDAENLQINSGGKHNGMLVDVRACTGLQKVFSSSVGVI